MKDKQATIHETTHIEGAWFDLYDADGNCLNDGSFDDLISAYEWAAENGIKVVRENDFSNQ